MDALQFLAELQFPPPLSAENDPKYALSLFQTAVQLLPDIQSGRELAAVARMLLLSPSIWTGNAELDSRPVGLILSDVFRAVVRARIQHPGSGEQSGGNDEDAVLFVLALIGGVASCGTVASRQICAIAGIMTASPAVVVPRVELAFVAALNAIADGQSIDNDVSFAVCSAVSYIHCSKPFRAQIHATPRLILLLVRPLFSASRHPEITSIAGPLAHLTGQIYRVCALTCDLELCMESLSIISSASATVRGVTDAKEIVFASVAVLCGLIDGIQARARQIRWFSVSPQSTEANVAKSILLIGRDLSATLYSISLSGFATEAYLHSAAVGILLSCDSSQLDDLIGGLQATNIEHEVLFALNMTEKVLLSSIPLSPQQLSRLIQPAKQLVTEMSSAQTTMSKAIHEAAHSVILASLTESGLAQQNAVYVKDIYIPKVVQLYRSSEITYTQFAAAITALSNALAPGSGVLSSAAPSLAEDVLLPTLQNLIHEDQNKSVSGLFADAVLSCAPIDRVSLWLNEINSDRNIMAERIRKGNIPSVCAEGVVTWWFDWAQAGSTQSKM